MKKSYVIKAKLLWAGLIGAVFCSLTFGCTTQDFEYAGKSNAVYRVKIENVGDQPITYTAEVSFYYIDGKDSLGLSDEKTITANDGLQLVRESKKGVYGVSANIFVEHPTAWYRLTLEKGTGTGDSFVADSVVAERTARFTNAIHYGKIY